MNIQQLHYVVAIANSGTFREAAEKMYVSQPSLSISVRDLEKEESNPPVIWTYIVIVSEKRSICQ